MTHLKGQVQGQTESMNSAGRAQFQRKQLSRETAGLISELARALEMSASYFPGHRLGNSGKTESSSPGA